VLTTTLVLAGLILIAALLYPSVGHAGASGHLAAMALLSIPPEVMRPTALCKSVALARLMNVDPPAKCPCPLQSAQEPSSGCCPARNRALG
jgi:hypothetical protein